MADYAQGAVSVTTSPTLLCTIPGENDGVLIQNNGTSSVYLGGASVSASGATQGIQLLANATMTSPTVGGLIHYLYAVTASGTATVNFLFPS